MKVNMLGYVKNLLRKWGQTPDEQQLGPAVSPAPAPAPALAQAPTRQIVMAPRSAATPVAGNGSHQNGKGIELPLQPILDSLPLELQPRLKQQDAGALTICVPLEKILGQLSGGVVKISFGELRQAAPALFSPEADRDTAMVPLPLGEVLSRLNPALIKRRRVQRQVEVPADIASPFDGRGQGLAFSTKPSRSGSAPAPAPAPIPPPRQAGPPVPAPVPMPPRSGMTSVPTPPPPAASPVPFKPSAVNTTARPTHEPSLTPPAAPMAPAPAAPAPHGDPNPLLVNLTLLAEGWPEAVRHELVQLKLVDAKVALPAEMVERALRQGRVAFTWKTLRSWIKPPPQPVASAQDSLVLELPLKVVAPQFLARQKEGGKAQKKVAVDAQIPDLFFGFPRPESGNAQVAPFAAPAPAPTASPAAVRPADTNYYVWDDASDRARIQEDDTKFGPSPGTQFIAKYATPNEVVSRAAALDGVAGALIALPDGLMVASQISSGLNGDTLAAFLPQIFGKVNQCTKELRMGELNNVNFTVGNIPWKIFRVNAIFFAAFGRAGYPLPTAQLATLAAELDHKPK
jgi:predicted regulator of Ras-like GTPase activity (Roadblock/LC7/MglB family)